MDNIRSHLIRLNLECNENCSFCNVTEETEKFFNSKSLKDVLQEVQIIIKKEKKKKIKISLSGGEPTLRTDLGKIVIGIRKLGITDIELQTNASLLNKDLSNKLIKSGINKFFISFHSHKKDIFESYVGLYGIFDKIVENIKNLGVYKDIDVILNPVISEKNYKNLRQYFDFVKKEFSFIEYISLSFVQPHGKVKENIELLIDYQKVNKSLVGILDYAYKLGFTVNNPYCGLPICVLGWDKYNKNCVEIIENKELLEKNIRKNDNNKSYVKKCDNCIYKYLCNGVWNEYIQKYGDKGIKPIKYY